MIIDSLEEMNNIVSDHPNLSWDGWDVIWHKENPAGFLRTDGAIKNGKWYVTTRISPDRKGWDIPTQIWNSHELA